MSFFVYPAIDLLDGQCVRLRQGDFTRLTRYRPDPVDCALEFVRAGARGLHIVDLDGARDGRPVHLGVLERIRAAVGVPIQYGGGLRSLLALDAVVALGARPIVGTQALVDQSFLAASLAAAPDLVVAVDVRDGKAVADGWRSETPWSLEQCCQHIKRAGARRALVTDVLRDGCLKGVRTDIFRRAAASGLEVIAAGGISGPEDVEALRRIGNVAGCVVGRATYEGRFDPGWWKE